MSQSVSRRRKKKKIFKQVKGYRGGRSKLYRTAKEALARSLQYSYRDRKKRRGNFRRLWIIRINAACRMRGLSYSRFIHGLKKAGVELNRKQLSELAIKDAVVFDQLVEKAKSKLSS